MNKLLAIQNKLRENKAKILERTRVELAKANKIQTRVNHQDLLSFASFDYLSLSNNQNLTDYLSQAVSKWGVSSGGSPLVSGYTFEHKTAEEKIAQFCNKQRSILFTNGYMANSGIIAALANKNSMIFSDRENHASIVDGILLSRAKFKRYPHLDLVALEKMLQQSTSCDKIIICESVFSMSGKSPDIAKLVELATTYDAFLIIDDAHALGVCGKNGRGLSYLIDKNNWRVITVATLGKAAGIAGAFVAGHQDIIEFLIQKTRTYMFSTAIMPAIAKSIGYALDLIHEANQSRAHLKSLQEEFFKFNRLTKWQANKTDSAILPIIIGSNSDTIKCAQFLWDKGIWVGAIRPPTVAKGTARLRISLCANHSNKDIQTLAHALNQAENLICKQK